MDPLLSLWRAPDREPDWDAIGRLDWWRAMADCPQDPRHHAEGDVGVHTRMVVDALRAEPSWRDLPDDDRADLLVAAFLHDMGKPATTKIEEGRITADGHARVGSQQARRLLWERGLPFARREAICGLVRWHMRPGFLVDARDPERTALTIAQTARCDHLALLARADTLGRIAPNTADALERVAFFAAFCQETGCLAQPFAFASDHSRFVYFRTPGRDPRYAAWDDTDGELILLSGMPGAGKDTHIRTHFPDLPRVSLDTIRAEKGIAPTDPQEPVVLAGLDRLRTHLRRGERVVWNATNLRHEQRARPIGLAADYRCRVRIVYLEATPDRLFAQNRSRDAAVPEAVMQRYLGRWEVPTTIEAHTLETPDALLSQNSR